jgi:hypothetical protein
MINHNKIMNIDHKKLLISFEGCAWGCAFYIGVYKALIKIFGYKKLHEMNFSGTSSGALTACACASGFKWKILFLYYKKFSKYFNNYKSLKFISTYHHLLLKMILFNPNQYKNLNNRLFIGVTKFFDKNDIISKWNNNKEIINTIHSSMNIPLYCSYVPNYYNEYVIDGGLSKSFITCDNFINITVSPDDKNADINCNGYMNLLDFYKPITNKRLYIIIYLGYIKTIKYFNNHFNNNNEINVEIKYKK